MKSVKQFVFIFFAIIVFSCSVQAENPSSAGSAQWVSVSPGGETECSNGTPYLFFYRQGSKQKIAIIFEGGGGCWNDVTCAPEAKCFNPIVNESYNPIKRKGIFDFSHSDNPLRDYTIIHIPYCTADVHLGDSEVKYLIGTDKELVIRHNGNKNAMSAVQWLFDRIEKPDVVFVTGLSAGSIASPFYAGIVAEKYPRARVVQIGDSAGAYRNDAINSVLAGWGSLKVFSKIGWLSNIDPKSIDFESLYIGAGTLPNLKLAQVNYIDDQVQAIELKLLGVTEPNVPKLLNENLQEIISRVPSFRYYNIPGNGHTIFGGDEFYTTSVSGIPLSDWVRGLIQGQDVMSIEPEGKAE